MFLIKKAATFENLRVAIQDACGWTNSHLFAFHKKYGEPALDVERAVIR